jgi:hypothetical protein
MFGSIKFPAVPTAASYEDLPMKKLAFVSIATLVALAAPAQAMECGKEFGSRASKMMSASNATSLAEAVMVERFRMLVQGYDACRSGDMKMALKYFDKAMDTSS